MGGYNSGRHSGWPTADDGYALDVRLLIRRGFFVPRRHMGGSICWTSTQSGEQQAVIDYEADLAEDSGSVRLHYRVDGSPQDYRVGLTTTECNYGGRRWWFICPKSGRWCAKLHLPPGAVMFAARQAYRLSYRSQREAPIDRSHARMGRIRARLGDEYSYFEDPPPRRSRGMQQRTYDRFLSRLEAAEELHDCVWLVSASRLLGR